MIKARWWEVNPVSMCKGRLPRKIEDEEATLLEISEEVSPGPYAKRKKLTTEQLRCLRLPAESATDNVIKGKALSP